MKTYIRPESFTPCLSASALEVLIFLLFILEAHLFLQFFFPDIVFITPSNNPCSDSVSVVEAGSLRKLAALSGLGEKVPC